MPDHDCPTESDATDAIASILPATELPTDTPSDVSDPETELSRILRDVICDRGAGQAPFEVELQRLENQHGPAVYSELIHLLCHLRFKEEEARKHWRQIVDLRESMKQRLGSDVDLEVALVSYFVQVSRRIKNPMVIELTLFEQTRASAYRDLLTGLYNYRYFEENFRREVARADRANVPLSLVMIDIDDFKQYNDRHGHEAGNMVLTGVARAISDSLRETDICTRFGGEEFAVILPGTPKLSAVQVAERLRAAIARRRFPHEKNHPAGNVTASIGVATYPADADSASDMVKGADRAMYLAKAGGKNRVERYGESSRSFKRVQLELPGRFRPFSEERHPFTTVTVSEGGMLFTSSQKPPVGQLVKFSVEIPETGDVVEAMGTVIRVAEPASGPYEGAVAFSGIGPADRSKLIRYLHLKKRDRAD